MSCLTYSFIPSVNNTVASELNTSLLTSFGLLLPPANDPTFESFLAALYCAGDGLTCLGICPNADLAGIGVRTAFWLSSALQVAISPKDSSQGAWTTAVLTASIIIPAIKQKKQRLLTLYHATLVLNFATFSSLVSLAVAPMCSVWREGGLPEIEVILHGEEGVDSPSRVAEPLSNLPKKVVHRQRLILSLALLAQVSLQWTWAVMLFTDPQYSQTACSPETKVIFFAREFTARQINQDAFVVWPLWLLFNIGITLGWGALLVFSSSRSVHPVLSRRPSRQSDPPLFWRRIFLLDTKRTMVLLGNIVAFLLALLFLVTSEIQAQHNCIRGGENSDWSFGQVAAILVALAPAWSIAAALARRAKLSPPSDTGRGQIIEKDSSDNSTSLAPPDTSMTASLPVLTREPTTLKQDIDIIETIANIDVS